MHKFTLHSPFQSWKRGEYPVQPFVALAINSCTESENGALLLTPQLMTDSEIDFEVNCLIEELEEFRTAAKREVRSLQAKMLVK